MPSANGSERVVLARIVGAHALRGEVRARFFGDGPANLLGVPSIWLAAKPDDAAARPYRVLHAGSGRAGEVRLALEGVEGRNAAEELRGLFVLGAQSDLPNLADDDYYWHQLVGCDVEDTAGTLIGRVKELWETGAHDVLVVETQDGRRMLLPTAREIMTTVDLARGRITIDAIPGLLDGEAD